MTQTAKKQDVQKIVVQLLNHQARLRQIPISRFRRIRVSQLIGTEFKVNRHELIIDSRFAVAGNPFDMANRVLDTIVEQETRRYEQRARAIVEAKTQAMQWTAFLQRALSGDDYSKFIHSLNGAKSPIERGTELHQHFVTMESLAP